MPNDTLDLKQFKRLVRIYLADKGLTQSDLAGQFGYSESRLSKLLSGRLPLSDADLQQFSLITGVPVDELRKVAA